MCTPSRATREASRRRWLRTGCGACWTHDKIGPESWPGSWLTSPRRTNRYWPTYWPDAAGTDTRNEHARCDASALVGQRSPVLHGARLGRWLPPATAVRLLSLAAVVTALSTGFVLSIAAFLVLARAPAIATLGHWSTATVSLDDPIPPSAGLLAGATVLVLVFAALRRFALAGQDLATAAAACRRLGPGTKGLVIVDETDPDAYAVPGLTGRVV